MILSFVLQELELSRLQLCQEVKEKNQLLSQITDDVQSLEQVLDRTAKMFRRAHSERQEFISQWESSVQVLHQRDHDIHSKVQVWCRICFWDSLIFLEGHIFVKESTAT